MGIQTSNGFWVLEDAGLRPCFWLCARTQTRRKERCCIGANCCYYNKLQVQDTGRGQGRLLLEALLAKRGVAGRCQAVTPVTDHRVHTHLKGRDVRGKKGRGCRKDERHSPLEGRNDRLATRPWTVPWKGPHRPDLRSGSTSACRKNGRRTGTLAGGKDVAKVHLDTRQSLTLRLVYRPSPCQCQWDLRERGGKKRGRTNARHAQRETARPTWFRRTRTTES